MSADWETFCDSSYFDLWRVRRKNERGFNDGYHLQNGEEAKALVELLNRVERERDAALRQLDNLKASSIHSCHDQCQRPMCVLRRERDEAREKSERYRLEANALMMQRDELLERNAKLRDIADRALMLNQSQ